MEAAIRDGRAGLATGSDIRRLEDRMATKSDVAELRAEIASLETRLTSRLLADADALGEEALGEAAADTASRSAGPAARLAGGVAGVEFGREAAGGILVPVPLVSRIRDAVI